MHIAHGANRRICLLLVAAIVVSIGLSAQAQTVTWNSTSSGTGPVDGRGTWNSANTNWWNGTSNQAWVAGNTAWFGNDGLTTTGTVTVSGSQNAGGIIFGPTGTNRYLLTGGTIGLADSATIFLSGSYVPAANGGTGVGGASTITSRLVANNLTISPRAGETNITALTLNGSNSLTGTLVVSSSAAVKISSVNALNGGAAVTVNARGAVELATTGTYSNNFTLSDNGFGALRFNVPVTLSGAITLASDVQLNAGVNQSSVNGPIIIANGIMETPGSAKNLTIAGNFTNANGVMLLRGASTYSGSTTIGVQGRTQLEGGDNRLPAGTFLTVRNALTLGGTTFGAMSQEVSGLFGAQNEALIRGGASGTSTLVVNTAVSSTFNQTLGGVGAFDNNFGITKKGAGTLTLGFDATRLATYSGPTTVLEGTLTAGKVSNNSPISVAAGARYNFLHLNGTFGGPVTTTISGSGTVAVMSGTLTLASNNTFAGTFISGTATANTFLTGSNTFTGTTEVTSGTIELGNQFAIGGGGDIRFGGGTLRFSGSGTPDVSAQVKNSASAMSFDTNSQSITFANSLVASNTAGLSKLGAGVLTLSASNAFSGATRIRAGGLTMNNANALQNSTLDMNGADSGTASFSQASMLGGLSGARSLDMGGQTLSIGNNNASTTFSGALTNGSLEKLGAGVLTLSGSNGYAGATLITGGRLAVSGSGSINSTSGITLNGGSLQYNSNSPLTQSISFVGLGGGIFGTGVIGTALNIGAGAVLSPGNSPGTLTANAGSAWSPGGSYDWEINSLSGTAGSSWDLLAVTAGGLNLSGLSTSNTFNLNLITLTGSNTAGPLDVGYVAGSSQNFLLASFNSLAVPSGFSNTADSDLTGLFTFNLAGWQGLQPNLSNISVKVDTAGTGLSLVIVPEPGSLALCVAGLSAAAIAAWRRGTRARRTR